MQEHTTMWWSLSKYKCPIFSWRVRYAPCFQLVMLGSNVISIDLQSEPQLWVKDDIRTPFCQAAPNGVRRLPYWTDGFGAKKKLLLAFILSGRRLFQVPRVFLRDCHTTVQLKYPNFTDQHSNLGVLKIFHKCWAYHSMHCSLTPEINGHNNSQKIGISVPSCSISLPWEHNMLLCGWRKSFIISFLLGLKLLQGPSERS